MKYVAPKSGLAAYTCPHCGVYAQQVHCSAPWGLAHHSEDTRYPVRTSYCMHCGRRCLWHEEQMVSPARGNAPPPNPDMPADVKQEYDEATAICQQSPRGAAAVLRLAIQRLCAQLEPEAKDINEAIGRLVRKGLPGTIQQALDIVRVTGNNAVHPGVMDTDDIQVVEKLFPLVNLIVEYAVSAPNRVAELYRTLPDSAQEGIEKRDA